MRREQRGKPLRALAALLVVGLLLPLLPVGLAPAEVWAADPPVLWSDSTPVASVTGNSYVNYSWTAMQTALKDTPDANFTLHRDVILEWKEGASIPYFSGNFDGGNHTIYLKAAQDQTGYFLPETGDPNSTVSSLNIDRSMGVFGVIDGGRVHNLRISPDSGVSALGFSMDIRDPFIQITFNPFYPNLATRRRYSGGFLAGRIQNGATVHQVEVTGLTLEARLTLPRKFYGPTASFEMRNKVMNYWDHLAIGGVVGSIEGESNVISQCHSEVDIIVNRQWPSNEANSKFVVTGTAGYTVSTGGIVGAVWQATSWEQTPKRNAISDCFYRGSIAADADMQVLPSEHFPDTTYNLYYRNNAGGILGAVSGGTYTPPSDAVQINSCVADANIAVSLDGTLVDSYDPYQVYTHFRNGYFEATAAHIVGRISNEFTQLSTERNYYTSSDTSLSADIPLSVGAGGAYNDVKARLTATGSIVKFSASGVGQPHINPAHADYTPFEDLTAMKMGSSVWENYAIGGGVKLAWREWDTREAPEIEVRAAGTADKTVLIKNPDDSVAVAGDEVAFSIDYHTLGRPASPDSAVINLVTDNGTQAVLELGSQQTDDTVPLNPVYYITATLTVTRDSSSSLPNNPVAWGIADTDWVFDNGSTALNTNWVSGGNGTAIHEVVIKGDDPHDSSLYPDALLTATLPAGWFQDSVSRTISINLADEVGDESLQVEYVELSAFLTQPPTGVKFYWQVTDDATYPSPVRPDPPASNPWEEYNHLQGIAGIILDGASPRKYLYAYAERDDGSATFGAQRSEMVRFELTRGKATGVSRGTDDGNDHGEESGGPAHIIATGANCYNYPTGFSLRGMLAGEYPVDGGSDTGLDVDITRGITIKAWYATGAETQVTTYFGAKLERPGIYPNAETGVIGDSDTVTIRYPNSSDDVMLFYKVSYTQADALSSDLYDFATALDACLVIPGGTYDIGTLQSSYGIHTYTTTGIPFPTSDEYMTVWAVAAPGEPVAGEVQYSDVAKMSYSKSNRPPQDAPQLYVDGVLFQSNIYYTPDSVFTLGHSGGGTIYYSIDGDSFAPYVPNVTQLKLYDYRNSFDSTTLQTYYALDNFENSTTLTYTVYFSTSMDEPGYTLTNPFGVLASGNDLERLHRAGNTLIFTIPINSIPAELRPINNEVTVAEAGDYNSRVPLIRYTWSDTSTAPDDPDENSTLYQAASPRLVDSQDNLLQEARPAQQLAVGGDAGQVIHIKYRMFPQADGYLPGEVYEVTLRIRDDLSKPAANPDPGAGTLERNLPVRLYYPGVETGTAIYYTTDGTAPEVVWNNTAQSYEIPAGSTTQRYSASDPIIAGAAATNPFDIRAITVSTSNSLGESEVELLHYTLGDLPRAEAPTTLPETSNSNPTALARNTRITLRSDTLGVDLYYTTDGSIPDPDSVGQPGSSTQKYSSAVLMDPASGDTQFVINAVARDSSGNIYSDSAVSQSTYVLSQAQAPTSYPVTTDSAIATLQPGETIVLSSATAGVNIYYTTNNTVPVPGGSGTTLYTSGITMPSSTTSFFNITAIAIHPSGMVADSEVVRFSYQPPAAVQAVSVSPGAGQVVKGTEVKLSTTTQGATIYYEVSYGSSRSPDDAVPFESQPYGSPIVIDQRTKISAIAYKDGVSSVVTEYEFTVSSQVATPTPSIPAGSVVPRGTKLTLSTSSSASIVYTKDGSDPTDTDNKNRMYGSEIALDAEEGKSVSISAYATQTGMTPSEIASFSYTIAGSGETVTANPPGDTTVSPGDLITLTSSITDGAVYYTTDGSAPVVPASGGETTGSTRQGSVVSVEGQYGDTFVVRAVVHFHGYTSTPQTFTYRLVGQTSPPSASIPSGAVIMSGAQVTLSAPEGFIYYTTDGSDPNSSSQMYTGPFELSGSTVLKAIAIADGKAQSTIAQYIYTMAGQVAAPAASELSGALAAGAQITLSTGTEGATIYYSTNGTDPTVNNLRDLFVYDSPITISRPVTIKMFAVKNGMHASVVNTVTYTVLTPPEEEEELEEDEESRFQTGTDRLFLFDQFVDAGDGPLFEDLILEDPVTQVVVSAEAGALPDGVELVVTQDRDPSAEYRDNVMRSLDLRLETLYDVSLVYAGEAVQPQLPEAVEVGLPIPRGYEDTVVIICHISDNGTVTGYPTRRSGGVVYAVVDHFSKFAVAVPDYDLGGTGGVPWLGIGLGAAGGVLLVGGALAVVHRKKKKRGAKQAT